MAKAITAWGIDIGQVSLKALRLREVEGQLQADALEIIEYPQILSEPQADGMSLIREALENFMARHNVAGSVVCVSAPGQTGFTRFVKLPPVETKKVPDIVRFEAQQQIPFAIDETVWRWQRFQDPNSPDVEIGIFAMKRDDISEVLRHFEQLQLPVDMVQMTPLALYNFMSYDGQLAPDGATLLCDVGANKTDLVVAEGPRIWTRTVNIGGSDFTEALVKAFKLSFAKAEKLKRTAATSKYARQIFQAMRPVFADLSQEIQRSVGYYTSMRRDARFKRVLGLGNGFRLPGLQKFLEQQLSIPVTRVDGYNRLTTAEGVNVPAFEDNVLSLAVPYGLAVQGLELSKVTTNLLPDEVARRRRWKKKQPWFVAAAVVLLLALAGPVYRAYVDLSALSENEAYSDASRATEQLTDWQREYDSLIRQVPEQEQEIERYWELFGYRSFWPSVQAMISQSIATVAKDQPLIEAYASARSEEQRQAALAAIGAKDRRSRLMLFAEEFSATFVEDVSKVNTRAMLEGRTSSGRRQPSRSRRDEAPSVSTARRGYFIKLTVRTPLPEDLAIRRLINFLRVESKKAAFGGIEVVDFTYDPLGHPARRSGGGGSLRRRGQVGQPDLLLPGEDMSTDTRFALGWLVAVTGDGLEPISQDLAVAE